MHRPPFFTVDKLIKSNNIITEEEMKKENSSKKGMKRLHLSEINLDAIFWDLPQIKRKETFKKYIEKIKENKNSPEYKWVLSRFLEYGRVKDTLMLFSFEEIKKMLNELKLSGYTQKKWRRLLDVYGSKRK